MSVRGHGLRLAAGVGAVALLLAATDVRSTQRPPTAITFLTNYVFQGRHAPFFVGRDQGFYRDAGFDVTIQPTTGSGFVISAIDAGKADYGMAESASVVQAVARGAKVKGFAVFMDVSTSGLASLSPVAVPKALVGKTIAASLTDSARVILPTVFARAGLDPAGITWVTADPSVYFSLLLSGRAELITASIDGDLPALRRVARSRQRMVHFASFAGWGYDVFGYFLVTRSDRLTLKPDEVRAFAAATARAVSYASDHPEEAARSIVRNSPTLDYETALAQWRESLSAIRTPFVQQHGYGHATETRLRQTIAMVNEAFTLNATLAPSDIYAEGLVPR
jgi:NitT/TauT family transport system substrate-binding protein